jgi:glycosyltransferase involved in cell wall biosynthesis
MEDKEQKMVSIVLPTYNGNRYLEESIKSCLDQTYRNFELIIVDDGSAPETDPTKIVEKFVDDRIRYIKHDYNQGIAKALNTGFNNATGQYLTWTSDDNHYESNAIEEMVKFLDNNPDIDFVCANSYIIDEQGKIIKIFRADDPRNMDIHNTVGACFLYKREVWKEVGEYKTEWRLVEDYEYWLRVREKFQIRNLNENLYYYRTHLGSLTGKNKIADIEGLAYKASLPYISKSAKFYRSAKVNIYGGKRLKPLKYILIAIFLKPTRIDYWKLLALSGINLISPSLAMNIRRNV